LKKDRYVFPAIFEYTGEGISVTFPDLPGCVTCGDDDEEAAKMAREAMALHIFGMEEDGELIPEPTQAINISIDQNQVIVLIEAWMPPFRDEMQQKAVKKTLTIPKWLDVIAQEHNINFSHILQEALKEYLGVNTRSEYFKSNTSFQLTEVSINDIPNNADYLINESKGKAIKIPDNVLQIIRNKLRSNPDYLHESILASNMISVAIQLKAENGFSGFWKFLFYGLTNPLFNDYFDHHEVTSLIDFFSQVPHGYQFTDGNRIWAHGEVGSLISF
jgi:Uncharacterized conserved protein